MADRKLSDRTVIETVRDGGSIVGTVLRRANNTTFKGAIPSGAKTQLKNDPRVKVVKGYDGIETISLR